MELQVLAPAQTPVPVAQPAAPFAVTQQTTIDSAAGATIALPSAGGFGGTLAVPAAAQPGPADVALTFASAPLAGPAVPPLGRQRAPRSSSAVTPILFVGFSSARTLELPRGLSWVLRLPAARLVPGASYDLALYDPGAPQLGWQFGYYPLAQPQLSGQLTFVAPAQPFTLVAQRTYYFTLLALAAGSPLPTAAPSPAPAPTPTPTAPPSLAPLLATPASIGFTAPGQTSPLMVVEPGYAGPFVAVSDATDVATVSGGGASFTVTSGPSNGAAHITISDPRPGGASLRVDVLQTFTTVVVHGRRRLP